MADPKKVTVQLKNTGDGPRYVHQADGNGTVVINPKTVSEKLVMLQADVDDLPEGLEVADGTEAEGDDADAGKPVIPDDMADANSRDGMKKKDDLLPIAAAANVTLDGTETKADIVAKVVAARAAAQQ